MNRYQYNDKFIKPATTKDESLRIWRFKSVASEFPNCHPQVTIIKAQGNMIMLHPINQGPEYTQIMALEVFQEVYEPLQIYI